MREHMGAIDHPISTDAAQVLEPAEAREAVHLADVQPASDVLERMQRRNVR
jgi:hypothetical protein